MQTKTKIQPNLSYSGGHAKRTPHISHIADTFFRKRVNFPLENHHYIASSPLYIADTFSRNSFDYIIISRFLLDIATLKGTILSWWAVFFFSSFFRRFWMKTRNILIFTCTVAPQICNSWIYFITTWNLSLLSCVQWVNLLKPPQISHIATAIMWYFDR